MLSYVIVGSGYRAAYFGRIAAAYPDLFRALFLCRSREKAALMQKSTGIGAVTEREACLSFRPDFIVVAVDRPHVADTAEEWLALGYPVLAETPIGDTEEKLVRLWRWQEEKKARIVCCEQYRRYPVLAAGLEAVARGMIGKPVSAYLSLAHDYHAFSLIRGMLLSEGEAYALRGAEQLSPAVETDSRQGAILDGRIGKEERKVIQIAFSSGKTAVYDFAPLQYRSFIRSRHLTVRGERGEWSDRIIFHLDESGQPRRIHLMPDVPAAYRALDNQALRDLRKTWQPELFLDTAQDEFAIASILLDMEKYLQGGKPPYPLRDALEDAYFWLLAQKAVQSPWREIIPRPMPWHSQAANQTKTR